MYKRNVRCIKHLNVIKFTEFPKPQKDRGLLDVWITVAEFHTDSVESIHHFLEGDFVEMKKHIPEQNDKITKMIRNFMPFSDKERIKISQIRDFKETLEEVLQKMRDFN